MIKVKKIVIHDFKRIKTESVPLAPITALVGGNTSGKSSVLQAAQLCVSMLQASYVRTKPNKKIEYLQTLANEAVSYRPTDILLNLRHGEPANQSKSFLLGYECEDVAEDGTTTQRNLSIAVTRGKNANLALEFTGDLSLIPILGNRDMPFSIFTPGLSGIPLREEWRTRGALDAAAMHGDANLYLRTLLDHLLRKNLDQKTVKNWCSGEIDIDDLPPDSPWHRFCTLLDKCYAGARIYVNHDNQRDRYVEISVAFGGQISKLDMASTGMLQVIQILAYACFYTPPLLLLDEPDAHLHADSQTKLHLALKSIVSTTDTRIVLATHSPQLIQHMLGDDDASVVWMDQGKIVPVPKGDRPAIPVLMELGALSVGAGAFDPKNKLVVLTEDSEKNPIRRYVESNGAKDYACLSYNGCGNLSGARQLAGLLRDLRPEAKIIIHRDRDYRTTEEMSFEIALAKALYEKDGITGVAELFTPLNDVEHCFLNIEHLSSVFDGIATKQQLQQALDQSVAKQRDEITNCVRKARNVINRDLYDSERMKNKTALRTSSGIADKSPKDQDFLPKDGTTPLKEDQWHGKTVYRAFLKEVHTIIKGDTKRIPKLIFSHSPHLKSPEWAKEILFT